MANRQMYWIGSNTDSIDSFNFNIASNWLQRKTSNGVDYLETPTSSPSSQDIVNIGVDDVFSKQFSVISPCLFGGYSGNASSGTWNSTDAVGGTHGSALSIVNIGNINNNSGNYSERYPFAYLGTGLVEPIASWVVENESVNAGITYGDITTQSQNPLNLKAEVINVSSIGVDSTTVQFSAVKNWSSFGYQAGATAAYGVACDLNINSSPRRSGNIVIGSDSWFTNIRYKLKSYNDTTLSASNHCCSENIKFYGMTAGNVYIEGSPIMSFSDDTNIGKMYMTPGYWQGVIEFGGRVTRTVYNQLNAGLSGATGGSTAASASGTFTISPLKDMVVLGSSTSLVAPYNTAVGGISQETYLPMVKFVSGFSAENLYVTSNQNNKWDVRFGGSSTIGTAIVSNCIVSSTPPLYSSNDTKKSWNLKHILNSESINLSKQLSETSNPVDMIGAMNPNTDRKSVV